MCPHGYHHSGFMATPALGTQEVCIQQLKLNYSKTSTRRLHHSKLTFDPTDAFHSFPDFHIIVPE